MKKSLAHDFVIDMEFNDQLLEPVSESSIEKPLALMEEKPLNFAEEISMLR